MREMPHFFRHSPPPESPVNQNRAVAVEIKNVTNTETFETAANRASERRLEQATAKVCGRVTAAESLTAVS